MCKYLKQVISKQFPVEPITTKFPSPVELFVAVVVVVAVVVCSLLLFVRCYCSLVVVDVFF